MRQDLDGLQCNRGAPLLDSSPLLLQFDFSPYPPVDLIPFDHQLQDLESVRTRIEWRL